MGKEKKNSFNKRRSHLRLESSPFPRFDGQRDDNDDDRQQQEASRENATFGVLNKKNEGFLYLGRQIPSSLVLLGRRHFLNSFDYRRVCVCVYKKTTTTLFFSLPRFVSEVSFKTTIIKDAFCPARDDDDCDVSQNKKTPKQNRKRRRRRRRTKKNLCHYLRSQKSIHQTLKLCDCEDFFSKIFFSSTDF